MEGVCLFGWFDLLGVLSSSASQPLKCTRISWGCCSGVDSDSGGVGFTLGETSQVMLMPLVRGPHSESWGSIGLPLEKW